MMEENNETKFLGKKPELEPMIIDKKIDNQMEVKEEINSSEKKIIEFLNKPIEEKEKEMEDKLNPIKEDILSEKKEKSFLGKKRECPEGEKEKTTKQETGDKSENDFNNSNSEIKTEKEKEKGKQRKPRAKKKSEMKREELVLKILKKIRDIKKKDIQKTLEDYIKNIINLCRIYFKLNNLI